MKDDNIVTEASLEEYKSIKASSQLKQRILEMEPGEEDMSAPKSKVRFMKKTAMVVAAACFIMVCGIGGLFGQDELKVYAEGSLLRDPIEINSQQEMPQTMGRSLEPTDNCPVSVSLELNEKAQVSIDEGYLMLTDEVCDNEIRSLEVASGEEFLWTIGDMNCTELPSKGHMYVKTKNNNITLVLSKDLDGTWSISREETEE